MPRRIETEMPQEYPSELSRGPLCQVGICPFCHSDEVQTLVFAGEDGFGPVKDGGEVRYQYSSVLSLFRCQGCRRYLLYDTCTGLPTWWNEEENANWVAEMPPKDFLEDSRLLFPTKTAPVSVSLDPSTPASVKECFEIGLQVRPISMDLYALQLRKALEAVCKDLGVSEFLASGKRAMLWQQIDELGRRNIGGEFICKAAHELKDISNTGAHYCEHQVAELDVRKLEQLLAIITTYIYGAKQKREE